jgi:hypothetical protein
MNNSTDKWPEGYKGLVSAVQPVAPTLSYNLNIDNDTVTLNWSIDTPAAAANSCIPITGYNVYENGQKIATVAYNTGSYTVSNLVAGNTYTYYVTAFSSSVVSGTSNTVSVSL